MPLLEQFKALMSEKYDRPLDRYIACHKFLEANQERLTRLFQQGEKDD